MIGDIYYLKNPRGEIEAEFKIDEEYSEVSITGTCRRAVEWYDDGVIDYDFFATAYCKWDSCTHWHFLGEDYSTDLNNADSYYHLCGPHCIATHIRLMCFVWKLMSMLLDDHDYGSYNDYNDLNDMIELALKGYTIVKKEEAK